MIAWLRRLVRPVRGHDELLHDLRTFTQELELKRHLTKRHNDLADAFGRPPQFRGRKEVSHE